MNSDPGGSMSRKSAEWKDFEYIRRANLPLSTTTTSRKIIRQIKKSSQRPFSFSMWKNITAFLCLCLYDAKCYCCFQWWIKFDFHVSLQSVLWVCLVLYVSYDTNIRPQLVSNISIWKGIWTVIRLKIDVMFEGLNHSSVDFLLDLVGFIFS